MELESLGKRVVTVGVSAGIVLILLFAVFIPAVAESSATVIDYTGGSWVKSYTYGKLTVSYKSGGSDTYTSKEVYWVNYAADLISGGTGKKISQWRVQVFVGIKWGDVKTFELYSLAHSGEVKVKVEGDREDEVWTLDTKTWDSRWDTKLVLGAAPESSGSKEVCVYDKTFSADTVEQIMGQAWGSFHFKVKVTEHHSLLQYADTPYVVQDKPDYSATLFWYAFTRPNPSTPTQPTQPTQPTDTTPTSGGAPDTWASMQSGNLTFAFGVAMLAGVVVYIALRKMEGE
jgi:hypothetical protein